MKKYLKVAQDRQKSYMDQHRREMEYEVGDKVFLKYNHRKGFWDLVNRENWARDAFGPYEIIERIEPLAYKLALP